MPGRVECSAEDGESGKWGSLLAKEDPNGGRYITGRMMLVCFFSIMAKYLAEVSLFLPFELD